MNTLEQIKEKIKERIKDDEKNLEMYNTVAECFEKLEGKEITKRFSTLLEKSLPTFTFHYEKNKYLGGCSIKFWEKSINENWNFTIGKDSFSIEEFAERNACYGSAAQERIDKNTTYLNDEKTLSKIAQSIDQINQAKTYLKEFDDYRFPAWYSIQKLYEEK